MENKNENPILERIGKLKPADEHLLLVSPGETPGASDLTDSLDALQHLLKKQERTAIERISLHFSDEKTLNAVMDCLKKNPPKHLGARHLTLELAFETPDVDQLTEFLQILSHAQVESVSFVEDPQHSIGKYIENFTDKVLKNEDVACVIKLPAQYQQSEAQRQLDGCLYDRQWEQKIQQLFGVAQEKSLGDKESAPEEKTPLRTRHKTSHKNVTIDIQQEQQIETTSTIVRTFDDEEDVSENSSSDQAGKCYLQPWSFANAMSYSGLPLSSQFYLLPYSDKELWEQARDLILNCLGEFRQDSGSVLPPEKQISMTAMHIILQHADKFQAGFDYECLPPGFFRAEKEGPMWKLDYDAALIKTAPPNPLAVQYRTEVLAPCMPHHWKAIYEKLHDTHPVKTFWDAWCQQPYQREADLFFRQMLPKILLVNEEAQAQLFDLCYRDGVLHQERLTFLLTKPELLQDKLVKNDRGLLRCIEGTVVVSIEKLEGDASLDFPAVCQKMGEMKIPLQDALVCYDGKLYTVDIQQKGCYPAQSVVHGTVSEEERQQLYRSLYEDIKKHSGQLISEPLAVRVKDITSYQSALSYFDTPDLSQKAKNFLMNYERVKPHPVTTLPESRCVQAIQYSLSQGLHPDALLQLWLQYGDTGITAFHQRLKDYPWLLEEPILTILKKSNSYASYVTPLYRDILSSINALTGFELEWWRTLVQQHANAQEDVDLRDLWHAFDAFRKALPEIDKKLKIDTPCTIQGVHSLPTTLSRMLTLLKKVEDRHRLEQWKHIQGLDFSSRGMMNAITKDKWAFVTPEMALSLPQCAVDDLPHTHQKVEWSHPQFKYTKGHNKNAQSEPVEKMFFRFIGGQKNNKQYSLAFYRYVHTQLQALKKHPDYPNALTDRHIEKLYMLIARATTGDVNTAEEQTEEEARKDFDFIYTKIEKLNDITMMKKEIRSNMLECMNDTLKKTPSLPMLKKMTALVFSFAPNLLKAISNKSKILELHSTFVSLDAHITRSGDAVYRGMQDYTEPDYEHPDLLGNYEATLKNIHTHLPKKDIQLFTVQGVDNLDIESMAGGKHSLFLDDRGCMLNKWRGQEGLTAETLRQQIFDRKSCHYWVSETGCYYFNAYTQEIETVETNEQQHRKLLNKLLDTDQKALVERKALRDDINHRHEIRFYYCNPQRKPITLEQIPYAGQEKELHTLEWRFPKHYFLIQTDKPFEQLAFNTWDSQIDQAPAVILCDEKLYWRTKRGPLVLIECNVENEHAYNTVLHAIQQNNKILFRIAPQEVHQAIDCLANTSLFMTTVKNDSKTSIPCLTGCNDTYQAQTLIRLISRFGLDTGNVQDILKQYYAGERSMQQNIVRDRLMRLLDAIVLPSDKPKLTVDILKDLLEKVQDLQADQVKDCLAQYTYNDIVLKAYFPNGFFEIKKKALTREQELQVEQWFPQHAMQKAFKAFLFAYDLPEEEMDPYSPVMQKFACLFKVYTTSEQRDFICKNLFQSLGLYQTRFGRKTIGDEAFLLLVDRMATNPFDHVVNLAQAARAWYAHSSGQQRNCFFLHPEDASEWAIPDFALRCNFIGEHVLPHLRKQIQERKETQFILYESDCMPLLQSLVLRASEEILGDQNQFLTTMNLQIIQPVNTIVRQYPMLKRPLLRMLDVFLRQDNQPDAIASVAEFLQYGSTLCRLLGQDNNALLSFFLQYQGKKPDFYPQDLVSLLQTLQDFKTSEENQARYLKIAIKLINNDSAFTVEQLRAIHNMAEKDNSLYEHLDTYFKAPPYPALDKVIQWFKSDQVNQLHSFYETFAKNPYPRLPANNFDTQYANQQLALFQGGDKKGIPGEEIEALHRQIQKMRNKTIAELQQQLGEYKNAPNPDYTKLLTTAAELLYRSKGMGIHTTQYLALMQMLQTPGHVTAQIGTGEGKSRIMMIMNVCQWALGKTVDFVTSDLSLATRDYVEYKAFFDIVGVPSSLIFADSPMDAYLQRGINFSDPTQLSLFRNQARSIGRAEAVIDKTPAQRALLLDEGDKLYYDMTATRFNYSGEAARHMQNMGWVYPLLMQFYNQNQIKNAGGEEVSPLTLHYENVDDCREQLKQFIRDKATKEQYHRFIGVGNAQIEAWQESAMTARHLKYRQDYDIVSDQIIATPEGLKLASKAVVNANKRASGGTMSFGVHQCLHAHLNLIKKSPVVDGKHDYPTQDTDLRKDLNQGEYDFHIQDEGQIIYSATAKNLIDDYQEGTLKTVTGTYGAKLEREEIQKTVFYRAQHKMTFMKIPRHKKMQRADHPLYLTKNADAQFEVLVQHIREARSKNQPVALIAENDVESARLYQRITERLGKDKVQRVFGKMTLEEEKQCIEHAGTAGYITISTEMIGRGTDIGLDKQAQQHGLHVLLTYLPRKRDLQQIIGRAGRFGQAGDTRMVLDKERLERQLGRTLGTQYFRNVEGFIKLQQRILDKRAQNERFVKNALGDFNKQLTDRFFTEIVHQIPSDKNKTAFEYWSSFIADSDKHWNAIWPDMQIALQKNPIDIHAVEQTLQKHYQERVRLWNTLIQNCNTLLDEKSNPIAVQELPVLSLDQTAKDMMQQPVDEAAILSKHKIAEKYDPAHEGRLVRYKYFFTPLWAIVTGERKLFGHFRAWLQGRAIRHLNQAAVITTSLFAVAGGLLGFMLLFTGILAPVGFAVLGLTAFASSTLLATIVGVVAGLIAGFSIGSGIDYKLNRRNDSGVPLDVPETNVRMKGNPQVEPPLEERGHNKKLFKKQYVPNNVENPLENPQHTN